MDRSAWFDEFWRNLPTVMTGALLAGCFVSLMLLPFVAQESDFRVTRRASGADDLAITSSYGYAQRYHLYLQLSEVFPGAEYIVFPSDSAHHQLLLLAFAKAGPTCAADGITELLLDEDPIGAAAHQQSHLSWEGRDPRSGGNHRIFASGYAERFLVVVMGSDIDVIDASLLFPRLEQRCDDAR